MTHKRRAIVVAALMLLGVALAAASQATTNRVGAIPAGYTGAEAKLPTAYKAPAVKSGTSCSIGFQNPLAANETLTYLQRGIIAEGKRLKCKLVVLDDALSVDKQVSNMQQLLVQKVNAIIFYPLDPKAVNPVLKQAKSQGVPVIAIDANFGGAPPPPDITTQVYQGRDIQAFLQAQAMAKAKPKAKVGLIGIGAPVPALKYLNKREAFWAKKNGLTVVGTRDNPSDDVTGGEQAANGLLQSYADMDAVIGYNDPSALGAATAARSAGRKITIVGLNGSSDGITAVKDGRIAATVQVDIVNTGVQAARAAYSLITKQNLPLPRTVIRPAALVTKANVNSIPSWAAQVKAIK
jgi:ABC-type sugar transport system substrate-binding protein